MLDGAESSEVTRVLDDQMIPGNGLTFRLGYELLPATGNSAPAKRNLEILVARTSLGAEDALQLATIQYAKWYCDDIATK